MIVNYTMWFIFCVILFTCFSLNSHLSLATERISADQTLTGDQTVSSEGGSFILGFFKPGNSPYYYIGIWYNIVSEQTVVWVANREKPVLDKYSSELRISNGNLVLVDESGIEIWSTNLSPVTSNSVEAVLFEEGNLVLRNSSGPNSSEPLWQSFDHPTHTWLPGGKLGLNKITRKSSRLTSWKNNDDPAPGLYSLEIDPNGASQYFIIWNRSKIMWTSGTWNGQIFSLVPEMRLNYIFNFSYFSNARENYFTYSRYNDSIVTRLLVDVQGQIQQQSWLKAAKQWNLFWAQPRLQCEVYAYCGAFASCGLEQQPFCHCLEGFRPNSIDEWNSEVYTAGCVRKTSLQCGNSSDAKRKSNRFLESRSKGLPGDSWTVEAGDAQECESTCLNNCSCTAYAYSGSGNDGVNCSFWFEDLLNIKQVADEENYGKTLYVKLAASEFSSYNNRKRTVIGVIIGLGSVVILVFFCMSLFLILRRMRMDKQDEVLGSMPDITSTTATTANGGGHNNAQLVIFRFKSILAATDNFCQENKLGEGGFGPVYKGNFPGDQEAAIKRLSRQSGQGLEEFMNELKLIANLQHKYLVRLLGCCVERDEKILIYEYMANRSLDKFLYEGVAQGLLYIHKFSRLKVIHRDLKASNILLDEAMNPKISDFGMARIFGINQTEANTNRAWELWKEGKEAELIDASIRDTCNLKEEDPIDRPTMSLVVLMLSSDTQTLPTPKEPAFLTRRAVECSTQGPNECSNNEVTISLPEGR
ncbi:S-locus-specific glycoprotein S6 precursor, putative [Ricinus communis]|uniref:Receptor-like serine/threonine-protein kinase n=1 Tax=Ricinus communis TaxID=3988 RepID=B9RLS4_RICCO|nr:S-locus-specific glycoprotein S6 precursor, putative [Ricinus communis]